MALTLTFSGILFSQSLSAVLGAGIVLIAYLFANRINFEVIRQIIVISLLLGIALVTVPPLMPEAYAKFSERIQQALSLDERADSARVDHLPANLRILGEAPIWGHGLASLSVDGANLDITTIAYALVPMERGFVGALLYFAPWFYITWRAFRLPRTDSARTPAVLLSALHLYVFATSSILYFLPYWFAFAVTASLVLRTHRPSRTASVPRLWNDLPDLNPPDPFLL
jgi:cell division protein FtsW (lipid II flippase)